MLARKFLQAGEYFCVCFWYCRTDRDVLVHTLCLQPRPSTRMACWSRPVASALRRRCSTTEQRPSCRLFPTRSVRSTTRRTSRSSPFWIFASEPTFPPSRTTRILSVTWRTSPDQSSPIFVSPPVWASFPSRGSMPSTTRPVSLARTFSSARSPPFCSLRNGSSLSTSCSSALKPPSSSWLPPKCSDLLFAKASASQLT